MTVQEFARRNGRTPQNVAYLIRKNRIPGVVFAHPPQGGRPRYFVPDNAEYPTSQRKGRAAGGRMLFASSSRLNPKPDPNMSLREAYAYLARHAIQQSYGEISQATGYPVLVLRDMYDKLHQRYGV